MCAFRSKMDQSKCLMLAVWLLSGGPWIMVNGRCLHQTTADAGHARSLQQLSSTAADAAIQLVQTPSAAAAPALLQAARLPAIQSEAVDAVPVAVNKTSLNTATAQGTVAPAVASASVINYPTPATATVTSVPPAASPTASRPPGSAAPAPWQSPQPAPTAVTAAPNATVPAADNAPGQQSSWSAGHAAAWVVQDQIDGTDVATSGGAESPTQSAWRPGWSAHPDANDLLLSVDHDHQDERAADPAGSVQVTVLHFNDWHVRVEPTKESYCALCSRWEMDQGRCSGGLARMSTFVKQERKQDPDLLLLNAGDDFIGTEWDRRADVDAPAAFMNLLGPDAMTIGNHEWDKGLDTLKLYLDKLNTTKEAVLGANIDFGGHQLKNKVQRYVVKHVKGKKVCIFGLTTQYALPNSDHMWPVKVNEPYTVGRQVLEDLEGQGCHATILLSHLGYTSDLVAAKVLYGVDAIVGGHSHSFLWPDQYDPPIYYLGNGSTKKDKTWGPYPTYVRSNSRDIPVVQASWGSRYMGKLVLTFDPESQGGRLSNIHGEPYLLGGPDSQYHVEEDQEALDKIKSWRKW